VSKIHFADVFISTKYIFGLCPSFNLEAFERQQLYEIWPYIEFIIVWPLEYNPIFSSSNSSYSKVYLNIDVIIYRSFRQPFLLMKSISLLQCLKSVYEAWSCLGARTIFLRFDTQQITIMNVVYGNSGRLLLIILLVCLPKSVADRLLPHLLFFLTSQISLARFFKNISIHCCQIHSALSKLSNGSQF
jgi:hypothetical protein